MNTSSAHKPLGMRVGEKRRLTIPPSMGYERRSQYMFPLCTEFSCITIHSRCSCFIADMGAKEMGEIYQLIRGSCMMSYWLRFISLYTENTGMFLGTKAMVNGSEVWMRCELWSAVAEILVYIAQRGGLLSLE